jgi:antitoxin component YwqK of YwqJK toxin-antitoxin module
MKKTGCKVAALMAVGMMAFCLNAKAQTDSIHKTYYRGAKLKMETPYTKGEKNGVEKLYDEYNGKLKKETPYTNGKKNGVEKLYNGNRIMSETPYTNGQINGVHKLYMNGKLQREIPYKDGYIIPGGKTYNYDEEGNLKK